jgi:hypothetical protein
MAPFFAGRKLFFAKVAFLYVGTYRLPSGREFREFVTTSLNYIVRRKMCLQEETFFYPFIWKVFTKDESTVHQ